MKLAIVVGHNSASQFAVFVVGALHMIRSIIDDRGDKAAWR